MRLVPVQRQFLGQVLGRAVQRIDIVAMGIEPVPHRIDGTRVFRQHLGLVAVGQGVVVGLRTQDRLAVLFMQPHESRGDARRGLQHRLDFRTRQAAGAKRRLLQRRRKVGGKLGVGAGRQFRHVQVIDLGQFHQEPRRCRALVGLDQRHIAGRNAQFRRHLRLRQPQRLPQHPQPLPDDQLFIASCHVTNLTFLSQAM